MSTDAIKQEQAYLDGLHVRVQALRSEVDQALAAAPTGHAGGAQDLVDRDAQMARLTARRADLDRAENGLYFGRLDRADGERIHIGRMGLRDDDLSPVLVDWRAPVAAEFYTATAASGTDILRRRHIRTRGRTVVGVNDELLDLDPRAATEPTSADFVGEGALMEALTATRTGRMGDIVATLQGEQDAIIRARPEGILVVQGGPGTGKTAVALHRAAFLLYTHPRIAERGVLVVGPNATFLSYIEQVLPSLGETQVVLLTPDALVPGITVSRTDPAAVAALKGTPAMAPLIAAAVADRQTSPAAVDLTYDGDVFRIEEAVIAQARTRALRDRAPHNVAGRVFREEIWSHLTDLVVAHTQQLLQDVEQGFEAELRRVDTSLAKDSDRLPGQVEGSGTEVTGSAAPHELGRVRAELEADSLVAAAVSELWPVLSAEQLIADLFGDEGRLHSAAAAIPGDDRVTPADHRRMPRDHPVAPADHRRMPRDHPVAPADHRLTPPELDLLRRSPGGGWSAADMPLLDEAGELLGVDETAEAAAARATRGLEVAYAQRVLAGAGTRGVSAEAMADRFAETDSRVLAERAAADRAWAYGHLVVDEAQELSPMQWRALLRRVPSGSMTVVGDVNQTSAADGTTSWDTLAAAHPRRTWKVVELTVSYRTPREVMDAAVPVLRALDPEASVPVSARPGGTPPWRLDVGEDLVSAAVRLAAAEHKALAGGHLAVIAPPDLIPRLTGGLRGVLPGTSWGADVDLEASCVVITPEQAKGLEFDGVLVADVAGILAAPRGLSALYVAMTRTTTRLGLLHTGTVPEVIAHLPERRG